MEYNTSNSKDIYNDAFDGILLDFQCCFLRYFLNCKLFPYPIYKLLFSGGVFTL